MVSAVGAPRRYAVGEPWGRASTRRPEIVGLRGIAIVMVVGFHFWGSGVSGGVDAFFVLSSYLLTYGLIAMMRPGRAVRVGDYLARTFRRLLGPQLVMIAVVVVLCAAVYPVSRWGTLVPHFWSSVGSVQNITLARESVDYYAQDAAAKSPLQHLWSLSMQGQVFVAWPLMIAALYWGAGYNRQRFVRWFAVAMVVVAVVSFGFAWHGVLTEPTGTYFDTRARAWEFAVGSLAALVVVRAEDADSGVVTGRRTPFVAELVAALGVVALVVTPWVASFASPFPGPIALLPTLGVAAFLVGTRPRDGASNRAAAVCSLRPLTWLGDRAFGVYLWHWPLLMVFVLFSGAGRPSLVVATLIVGVSIGLDLVVAAALRWVGSRWPSTPPNNRRVVGAYAAGTAVVVAAASLYVVGGRPLHQALVPTSGVTVELSVVPHPRDVPKEWQDPGVPCRSGDGHHVLVELKACHTYQAGRSQEFAVVGDSHAQQMLPAIMDLADESSATVRSYLLGGCRYPDHAVSDVIDEPCRRYTDAVVDELRDRTPDVVFLVGSVARAGEPAEEVVPGLSEALAPLVQLGQSVVLLRDVPRFDFNIFECGQMRGWEAEPCTVAVRLPPRNPLDMLVEAPNVMTVDVTDAVCPGRVCRPTHEGVVVYMDDNHLTRTFAKTLSPVLHEAVFDLGGPSSD